MPQGVQDFNIYLVKDPLRSWSIISMRRPAYNPNFYLL